MSFDGVFAGAIARELDKDLAGARIEKIQQPESDEIIMQAAGRAGRKKLLLCTNPQGARLHYTSLPYENPPAAPAFCMLLRKHIQGGRITRVYQIRTERIICFDIDALNEMGYSVNKRLILETMGRHSNLVLVDGESEKIIDSIKRIPVDLSRRRQILPGLKYELPPSQGKHSLWTLEADAELEPSEIEGLSRTLQQEIASSRDAVTMRDKVLASKLFPAVYLDKSGTPKEVHIVRLKKLEEGCKVIEFESPGEALDYYYSRKPEANRILQRSAALERRVTGLIKKQLLKKQRLLDEMMLADRADEYRIKGELINANIPHIKPGAKSVVLTNYYDGSDLEVALDEKLSPAKNAQAYFKRYSKLKGSVKEKLAQLAGCEADIAYLESVRGLISGADSNEAVELIRTELIGEGFIRAKKTAKRKNSGKKPEPKRFKLSGGYEVAVGRSGEENDYISFKLGKKDDFWFHAKDMPGSHVVLFAGGREPDAETIYETASIAAYYSKARDSENVPVDYLSLRHLKKPAGAKPGMVLFKGNRTIWVKPEAPKEEIR